MLLAPPWGDTDSAVERALDEHDVITGEFDLAAWLPRSASLPDWARSPHERRVRYVYPFAQIERDHATGRLVGEPPASLLPG